MKRTLKNNNLVETIFIVSFPFVFIIFSIYLLNAYNVLSNSVILTENPKCNKTNSLFSDSACLNEEIQKIYKFNLSNYGMILTDKELKEIGGVCTHFAEWYRKQLYKLGYESDVFYIRARGEYGGHAFTIAWDKNRSTYCILEQTEFHCFSLKPTSIKELTKGEFRKT